MLEAYSNNITVVADQAIPFNNVSLKKGCTAVLVTPTTIQFNKCGVYCVACDVSAEEATTTIQLYKNGVAQPQAQSTGGTPSIYTFVVAEENANDCPCTIPTTVQIVDDTAGTLASASVKVTKIC